MSDLKYQAFQDESGIWYVGFYAEKHKECIFRDWVLIISQDSFSDGGEAAAKLMTTVLNTNLEY